MNDKVNGSELLLNSLGNDYFNFTMDPEGNFLSLSDPAYSFFEDGKSDILDNLFHLAASDQERENLETNIMRCCSGNEIVQFTISTLDAKGVKRILDLKLIAIPKERSGVLVIQGLAHDITKRTIVNDALYLVAQKGWKEKGKGYFNSLVYFIGQTFSLDYVIIDRLIPGHKALTVGLYSHGSVQPELEYDLHGTPCENVIKCSLCVYKSRIQELFPEDILLQEMNAESYLGIPLWDSKGEAIGLIAILNEKPLTDTALIETILQIVAVRTAHEMERIRDEQELKDREKYLRTTLNSIGEGVITTDSEGIISSINPAAERLIGCSQENVLHSPLDQVLRLFEADGDQLVKIGEIIEDVVIGEQTVQPDSELILLDLNDRRHRISNLWSPLIREEGNVFGVVVTFRDVSNEYDLQLKLNHAQKLDAIGQLAGGVAHDFNNMLSGIINCATLLQSPKRSLDDKSLYYTGLILQLSNRAADLTSKLLAFGRKSKQITENIDMHELLDECSEILKRTIDRKIKISLNKTADVFAIKGDSSGLVNCFLNLGINAGQAMPEGGVLEISTENIYIDYADCLNSSFDISPGYYCKISVRDSGCGISKENLMQIFEPFFTTKETGKGTGLGLAAVYGIICEHHGTINVNSEPGKGTAFHICLPCDKEEIYKIDKNILPPDDNGKILLVDDESFILSTVSDLLTDIGFEVLTADDGFKALEIYEEKHFEIDLIILDMVMPDLNGVETLMGLKKINPHCKVILSSGFAKENELSALNNFGIFSFIKKPYDILALRELIKKAQSS